MMYLKELNIICLIIQKRHPEFSFSIEELIDSNELIV